MRVAGFKVARCKLWGSWFVDFGGDVFRLVSCISYFAFRNVFIRDYTDYLRGMYGLSTEYVCWCCGLMVAGWRVWDSWFVSFCEVFIDWCPASSTLQLISDNINFNSYKYFVINNLLTLERFNF